MDIKELQKTSFLKCTHYDGRVIPLQACFNDNKKWEWWIPGPEGLIKTQPTEIVEGYYFAKEPAKENDGFLAFSNFMLKRAYYNDVVIFVRGITEDFQNLGASIDKLNLFYSLSTKDGPSISTRYISTELEYIFKVCRSLFDLLQEIIYRIWKRLKYHDKSKKTKLLKQSFAKMILHNDNILTPEEIENKFFIPTALANFYYFQAKFFKWLREYRNKIDHAGEGFKLIFFTERGFAVNIDEEPFSELDFWNDKNTLPNKLGSVRSVIAYVILNTINSLEEFTKIISSIVDMPYDISPDYSVFIRSPHISALIESNKYINEQPWNK